MASMTISVDEDVKRNFSAFCNDVGLSASSLINVFMVTTARERRVPFTISAPGPGAVRDEIAELESDIALSRRQFAEGKGIPINVAAQNTLAALHAHCARKATV